MIPESKLRRLSARRIKELLETQMVTLPSGKVVTATDVDFSGWSKKDLVEFYLKSKVMDDENLLAAILKELKKNFSDMNKDNLLAKIRELIRVYKEMKEGQKKITRNDEEAAIKEEKMSPNN